MCVCVCGCVVVEVDIYRLEKFLGTHPAQCALIIIAPTVCVCVCVI